jgi:hypothetical protein
MQGDDQESQGHRLAGSGRRNRDPLANAIIPLRMPVPRLAELVLRGGGEETPW